MPKLPFGGFEGSAHYRIKRDKLVLRYRFPEQDRFHEKVSPYLVSRNQKRLFLEWARKFLVSGGKVPSEWLSTAAADSRELAKLDGSTTLGEAVSAYLHDCEHGNAWMKPRAEETLATTTRPVLGKFLARAGEATPLAAIGRDQISAFVRELGGKRETKYRHLCPISSLFDWAIREGHFDRVNPARRIVFWREKGEKPHDGVRKSYTDREFAKLVEAAATDPFALDAIYLCRYLALRVQDAVTLRWEDWKWRQLFVAVRRQKTRESGVGVSHVDIHPVLAERFADKNGAKGYCLEYAGMRTKIVWPDRETLALRVAEKNASVVARELGVTEAAVRKRLASAGRPKKISKQPLGEEEERSALGDSLSQRVARITKVAGLYEKGIQPLYVLRHTFASDSLRRGTPPVIVAREMGISVLTLEKYYFHAIPRGELDDRRGNRWGLRSSET